MAALQWKPHRQVITITSVANGRLPCDAIGSQQIQYQSGAQESRTWFPRPPGGVSSCLWSSAAGDQVPGERKRRSLNGSSAPGTEQKQPPQTRFNPQL